MSYPCFNCAIISEYNLCSDVCEDDYIQHEYKNSQTEFKHDVLYEVLLNDLSDDDLTWFLKDVIDNNYDKLLSDNNNRLIEDDEYKSHLDNYNICSLIYTNLMAKRLFR